MTATVTTLPTPQPPEGFRSHQVCEIAHVTYRQLDFWIRTGLIPPPTVINQTGRVTPVDGRTPGTGNVRIYSLTDVTRITLIATLLDFGLSIRRSAEIAAAADPGSTHLTTTAGPVTLTVQLLNPNRNPG